MSKKPSVMSSLREADRQFEESRRDGAPLYNHQFPEDREPTGGGGFDGSPQSVADLQNMSMKQVEKWRSETGDDITRRFKQNFSTNLSDQQMADVATQMFQAGQFGAQDLLNEVGRERFVAALAGRVGATSKTPAEDDDDDAEPAEVFGGQAHRSVGGRRDPDERVPRSQEEGAEAWARELGDWRNKVGLR